MNSPPTLAYPPRITDFTRPFFEALAERRLLTTCCRRCAETTFPPKVVCPRCWSRDVEWTQLSDTGLLRSFTEVHSAPRPFIDELPYVLGIIDLDDGPRCVARIDEEFDELHCDQRVELAPRPADPAPVLAFRTVG